MSRDINVIICQSLQSSASITLVSVEYEITKPSKNRDELTISDMPSFHIILAVSSCIMNARRIAIRSGGIAAMVVGGMRQTAWELDGSILKAWMSLDSPPQLTTYSKLVFVSGTTV